MAKVIKITHAVGTIKVAPSGNGESRDEVDARVNAKLAEEGWDDVEVINLKLNYGQDGALTDIVNMYIYRKYEDAPAAKSK